MVTHPALTNSSNYPSITDKESLLSVAFSFAKCISHVGQDESQELVKLLEALLVASNNIEFMTLLSSEVEFLRALALLLKSKTIQLQTQALTLLRNLVNIPSIGCFAMFGAEPSLLQLTVEIFEAQNIDSELSATCCHIVLNWSYSANLALADQTKAASLSPYPNFLPKLVGIVRSETGPCFIVALKLLRNLAHSLEISAMLVSPNLGFLVHLLKLVQFGTDEIIHSSLTTLMVLCTNVRNVDLLLSNRLHRVLFGLLQQAGPDVSTWKPAWSRITQLLVVWARYPQVATAIRQIDGVSVLMPLLHSQSMVRLDAALLISFVIGREENRVAGGFALLEKFPDILDMLIELFRKTLALEAGPG